MMYSRRTSEYSSHLSSNEERESPEKGAIVEEEESVVNGQPLPPTEIFKGQDLPRSDTPETYLTDIADKPDITLFCDHCKIFIDIRQLKYHRAFHNSLHVLHYKSNHGPETSEHLLKKRNAVLRKMKKEATLENPLEPKHVQQVNDAYELLKADLEDTFESCRLIKETVDTSCQPTALSCSLDCVYALGMCSSSNSKWKSEMEDTKVYQDSFGENKDKCYLGLFDGYHGRFSAEVAASLLHKMLLHEMMKFDESLHEGPAQDFGGNQDISHHGFVFGTNARLDGQTDKKDEKESSKPKKSTGNANKDTVTVIQPDDDDLTQRIIRLCEEKYEKLLQELPKSSRTVSFKTERPRHPMEDKIAEAFSKSYHLLDILLSYGKDEWSKVRWSGCSALSMVIESSSQTEEEQKESWAQDEPKSQRDTARLPDPPIEKGYVHVANAGNARGLLVRGNRVYRLSKDHSPNNSKERDRVMRQGGFLNSSEVECRVNGILATTRGLGNHGDPELKKCVLVEPHTCSVQIDQYAQFIVMATSGVWEILTDQEVASLLMRMLPQNQIPPPSKASTSLGNLLDLEQDLKTSDSERASTSKNIAFTDDNQEKGKDSVTHSEGGNEKGSDDAGVSEKATSDADALKIAADLKTEAGSHFGDAEDMVLPGDQDTVQLPVHSRLLLGGGKTLEDQRRNLAQSMAEHIVQAALLAGSRNNITVMVALLPGCGV